MTVCNHTNHKKKERRLLLSQIQDVTENPRILCNTPKRGQGGQERQEREKKNGGTVWQALEQHEQNWHNVVLHLLRTWQHSRFHDSDFAKKC